MYLTKEEERILDGEMGEALRLAMKILVGIGEIYDAERLIKISSAHISGISYNNIGDEGLEFLKYMCSETRFKVPTTVNPAGVDLASWKEMGISETFARKQMEIAESLLRAGAYDSFTCTPYLGYISPRFGEHISWGESSAVAFINSIVGARTNKEGGPSALAAALIGKTPLYGLHITRNRLPTVKVRVKYKVRDTVDFSALGYTIGYIIRSGVPLIEGIKVTASVNKLKSFSAGIAAASNIALYIMNDISPDARLLSEELKKNLETIEITEHDVNDITNNFIVPLEKPDLVFFGCPHYSLTEVERIVTFIRSRNAKAKVPVWIAVSRATYNKARKLGYIDLLRRAGIKLIRDMCAVVAPLRELGISSIATDSAKAAHYLSLRHGISVYLADAIKILKNVAL